MPLQEPQGASPVPSSRPAAGGWWRWWGGGRPPLGRRRSLPLPPAGATRSLDPAVRRALAASVARELPGGAPEEWDELLREFRDARRRLQRAQGKEQFLGMRCHKYRAKLREQAERLREERARHWGTERAHSDDDDDDYAETDVTGAVAGGGPDDGDRPDGALLDDEAAAEALALRQDVEALASERASWERRMEQWERDSDLLDSVQATHKQILVECEKLRRGLCALEKRLHAHERWQSECHAWVQRELSVPPPPTAVPNEDGEGHPESLVAAASGSGDDHDDLEAAATTTRLLHDRESAPETELCDLSPDHRPA